MNLSIFFELFPIPRRVRTHLSCSANRDAFGYLFSFKPLKSCRSKTISLAKLQKVPFWRPVKPMPHHLNGALGMWAALLGSKLADLHSGGVDFRWEASQHLLVFNCWRGLACSSRETTKRRPGLSWSKGDARWGRPSRPSIHGFFHSQFIERVREREQIEKEKGWQEGT